MKSLSQSELKSILQYDMESGLFYWLSDRGKRTKKGQWAGSIDSDGYIIIRFNGKAWRAARLAWLYVTGEMPAFQVDHKDGNRANDSFGNLRLATNSENQQNKKKSANKSSKYLGVHFSKKAGKFQALININGEQKSLGYFETEDEAHRAYLDAKSKAHHFQPIPRNNSAIYGIAGC